MAGARRWCLVAGSGGTAAPGSDAAAAGAAAEALPTLRLLADRTFQSRMLQAQGRLLVVAMLLAHARKSSPATDALVTTTILAVAAEAGQLKPPLPGSLFAGIDMLSVQHISPH